MIPLRDNIPSRTFPYITVALIAVNILVFLYESSLGKHLNAFIFQYGVVPERFFRPGSHMTQTSSGRFFPFFTTMFLHAGFLHLAGNMLYLWIFGDNVEDRMGHARFLIFYILCGIAAGAAHAVTNASSVVPAVGASGAIAGVLGAYYKMFPYARVLTLITFGFYWTTTLIPASFLLGFWFLMQLLSGTASLSLASQLSGGVAWWAHIGGFAGGYLLVGIFTSSYRRGIHDDYL